jgi:hypothetical protein
VSGRILFSIPAMIYAVLVVLRIFVVESEFFDGVIVGFSAGVALMMLLVIVAAKHLERRP